MAAMNVFSRLGRCPCSALSDQNLYLKDAEMQESALTLHVVAGVDGIGGQDQIKGTSNVLWRWLVDIPGLEVNLRVAHCLQQIGAEGCGDVGGRVLAQGSEVIALQLTDHLHPGFLIENMFPRICSFEQKILLHSSGCYAVKLGTCREQMKPYCTCNDMEHQVQAAPL